MRKSSYLKSPSTRLSLNSLYRLTVKKTLKLHMSGPLTGEPQATIRFASQRANNVGRISMSWLHQVFTRAIVPPSLTLWSTTISSFTILSLQGSPIHPNASASNDTGALAATSKQVVLFYVVFLREHSSGITANPDIKQSVIWLQGVCGCRHSNMQLTNSLRFAGADCQANVLTVMELFSLIICFSHTMYQCQCLGWRYITWIHWHSQRTPYGKDYTNTSDK